MICRAASSSPWSASFSWRCTASTGRAGARPNRCRASRRLATDLRRLQSWRRRFDMLRPMGVPWRLAACAAVIGSVLAFQRPFREFPGVEYTVGEIPLPPDYQEKTEWVFARLMYPPSAGGRYGMGRGFGRGFGRYGGDWTQGSTIWTQDFPRADRHFLQAVRRLTRLHVRSVEQPVNLDEGDA